MTAGDRLRGLAGVAGTAGALLLMLGSGATSGAVLVNYSGLPTGTATQHILVDKTVVPPPPPVTYPHVYGGGGGFASHTYTHDNRQRKDEVRLATLKRKQEDEIMLQIIVMAVSEGLIT